MTANAKPAIVHKQAQSAVRVSQVNIRTALGRQRALHVMLAIIRVKLVQSPLPCVKIVQLIRHLRRAALGSVSVGVTWGTRGPTVKSVMHA